MKLKLFRDKMTEKSTIGSLYVNSEFFCYTLEDRDRHMELDGKKVPGETAIPRGTYDVKVTYSNRFKQMMPLLLNVRGFDGIRIHPGNTTADTHGCILVGTVKGDNWIGKSRQAYERLLEVLEMGIMMDGGAEIEIV